MGHSCLLINAQAGVKGVGGGMMTGGCGLDRGWQTAGGLSLMFPHAGLGVWLRLRLPCLAENWR